MFDWLKGKKPPAPAAPAAPTVQLKNGVHVSRVEHAISIGSRTVECWVYRSDGLKKHGQREMLIAIPRTLPGEYLMHPVYHIDAVSALAAAGRLVSVGGHSEFGPANPGLFGRSDFRGVGYAPPFNLEGALPAGSDPREFLAVIALTQTELASSKRCGLARTLARLGHAIRFFPYPVWNDPTRAEVIGPDFTEKSLLGRCASYFVEGCAPMREEGVLNLRLTKAGAAQLAKGLTLSMEEGVGLSVFTTDGWSDCAACLTWEPGIREPMAILASSGPDRLSPFQNRGQRLLGCFVTFVVADTPEGGGKMIEDGFGVFLARADAANLVQSLREHKALQIAGRADHMPLAFVPV